MLEALCGNKNIQRILLFLFVNGKCYGTQLHRVLNAPLTPIQKALNRLEKGGMILSYYEGKTRVYQFNQGYPLFAEIEHLLKKAYTLLPAEEKKLYYVVQEPTSFQIQDRPGSAKTLLQFWEQLQRVTQLSFQAKSQSTEKGWHGLGKAEVRVVKEKSHVLVFYEKGSWQGKEGGEMSFSNVFRWTLDRFTGVIALEHLRHGIDHPVFLFYLAPHGKGSLASVDSHLCGGDTYFGQIHMDSHGLKLKWRVIGPKKNEELTTIYAIA